MSRKQWLGFKQPVDYCHDSGKVCFTKIEAVSAANALYKKDHTLLTQYACVDCQRRKRPKVWHLTKKGATKRK